MWSQFSSDSDEIESLKVFSKWILDIGDSRLGEINDGEALIEILGDLSESCI